jgi:hypothetical protein
LHAKLQLVPSHAAVEFAGCAQTVHDGPHAAVDVVLTQVPPQL